MKNKDENIMVTFARYSGLAFILPAAVFVGYAVGYGLDRAFSTGFFKIIFLVIGAVTGFLQLVRGLKGSSD